MESNMPSQPLPDPDFIDRDAQAVTSEMVSQYEAQAGKNLYPAQPERLMVDVIAYRETLLRIAIQEAAKQNLVRFARAPMLDYLGELVCVSRLPARAAQAAPLPESAVIPAGAGLRAKDGSLFILQSGLTLPAGAASATGVAVAAGTGTAGNGFMPGEITGPDGSLWPENVAAVNVTTSFGGAAVSAGRDGDRLQIDPRLGRQSTAAPLNNHFTFFSAKNKEGGISPAFRNYYDCPICPCRLTTWICSCHAPQRLSAPGPCGPAQ